MADRIINGKGSGGAGNGHYRKLPGDQHEHHLAMHHSNNENIFVNFFDKEYLGITFKEYGVFIGSVIAITIINFIIRDYLYQLSIDIILSLQENGRDPYQYWFFNNIRKLGDSHTLYGILLLIYVFCSRALAFQYTLVISTMMFFLCFMKMIIQYPRPYQYHADIIPTSCSGQWGCPSATSIRVGTICMSVFLDFVYEKRHRLHPVVYYAGCLATFIGLFGVMCSRVFLAAHSINQVIFGTTIGVEIALFLHFCVKPQVYKHLDDLSE